MHLIQAVIVSGIILLAFFVLNSDKDNILKNPEAYRPHFNYSKFEKMNFTISGFQKLDNDTIVKLNQTFQGYKNQSAFGMFDYTHNRNLDKMSLWHFFAYCICFFNTIMIIYCYFSNRKNEIISLTTFNNIVLGVLFIMFVISYEKFYLDMYNQYTNSYVEILMNTVGVLI